MTAGARFTPVWAAASAGHSGPWAEALLHRVAKARRFSLALDELPWSPGGGAGLVVLPLRACGVPGLGAGAVLARAVAGLGAPPVAAVHALRVRRESDAALEAFLADALEELEAVANGEGWCPGGSRSFPCSASGLTVDAFALGERGPDHGMAFDLLPGDSLVPVAAGAAPPEALGWVPAGGRPWWDVALSLARRAGLGLRFSLDVEAEGLAWVRGGAAGARLLDAPRLVVLAPEGELILPMDVLDHPPYEVASLALEAEPARPGPGTVWLQEVVRRSVRPSAGQGLLAPWPGEAEVALLPGGARALAWALEETTVAATAEAFWPSAGALARVALRLACVGAEPLGLGLAFHPGGGAGAAETLESAVLGVRQAALALDLPVLQAGLHEEDGEALGVVLLGVGVLDDPAPPLDLTAPEATALTQVGHRTAPAAFRAAGDGLFLLGAPEGGLDACYRTAACVREGVRLGLFRSAQGLGPTGVLGAALAAARAGAVGAHLILDAVDPALGPCGPGCVLASLSVAGEGALEALATAHGVPYRKVGATGGTRVALALSGRPALDVGLDEA